MTRISGAATRFSAGVPAEDRASHHLAGGAVLTFFACLRYVGYDKLVPNNKEIEIQVRISNSQPLLDFLEKNGEFKYSNRQVDEYYTPAHRDFASIDPIKEWIRLRDSDGEFSINYKNWHYDSDGKSRYCDEFETVIGDLDQLRKIFTAINLKVLVKVHKQRRVWNYKNYEIAVDRVEGLGDFVEIEYKGVDNADHKAITDGMIKFIKDIDCGEIRRNYRGYAYMLLYPDKTIPEELH